MTKLLRGPNFQLNSACLVATPNSGRKISNLPNKVKTKLMGALLVAINFRSTTMAELWAKMPCPNMGATTKRHSFWPIAWSDINIFQ